MENKDKIIKTLKDMGKLPSNKIGAICGINYNYLKPLLEELEKEKLIKSQKVGEFATYWEITKKGEKGVLKNA